MNKSRNKSRLLAQQYQRRKARTNRRAQAVSKPRIIVTRSNKYIYAQLLDCHGNVLAHSDDRSLTEGTKKEKAYEVGKMIGQKILESNYSGIFFDRNGYLYHGRVAALADGARSVGINF